MINTLFKLGILASETGKTIDFANHTSDFVEVVFSVGGQEVKGYCYPPDHHKPVKRMKNGKDLPFGEHGKVTAYVYAGQGEFKNENLDIPAIIRKKMRRVVRFRRTQTQPIAVLEVTY